MISALGVAKKTFQMTTQISVWLRFYCAPVCPLQYMPRRKIVPVKPELDHLWATVTSFWLNGCFGNVKLWSFYTAEVSDQPNVMCLCNVKESDVMRSIGLSDMANARSRQKIVVKYCAPEIVVFKRHTRLNLLLHIWILTPVIRCGHSVRSG